MTRYWTRPDIEVDVKTWTGDNLDEVAEFLGAAFCGARTTEKRVPLLQIMHAPATPVEVPPGSKLVRIDGTLTVWEPAAFAALFVKVAD